MDPVVEKIFEGLSCVGCPVISEFTAAFTPGAMYIILSVHVRIAECCGYMYHVCESTHVFFFFFFTDGVFPRSGTHLGRPVSFMLVVTLLFCYVTHLLRTQKIFPLHVHAGA